MKEDKDIGLKIADNSDEAFWNKVKSTTELEIKALEDSLKFNRAVRELAINQIASCSPNTE